MRQELSYRTFFKLKSMFLLKLLPGRGWVKVMPFPDLFMAKCVYTPDQRVFIIGGAKDSKTRMTLRDVSEIVL